MTERQRIKENITNEALKLFQLGHSDNSVLEVLKECRVKASLKHKKKK